MKKITENIIANAVGKFWTLLASVLFVPVYISLLGEEAYGIVTFFTVLQTFLNLMGAGLQKTLRREFANNSETREIGDIRKYKLLRSAELIYIGVAVIIIGICSIGAEFISNQWLKYETLVPGDVSITIALMGICIALQLFSHLYSGALYGLDCQVSTNLCQVGWTTLKQVGVILVLIAISNNIVVFYVWYTVCDLVYAVVLRIFLVGKLKLKNAHWGLADLKNLKSIWKYAGGLLVISIGSVFNTQLDKLVLSKYLSVSTCGAYNTTAHLGNLIANVPIVLGTAIFSKIADLEFLNKHNEGLKLFNKYNKKSTIIISTLGIFMALFSYEILYVWTGSETYSLEMKYAAPFVIFGYALNAIQQMPYDFLLAQGNVKINQIQLLCCIPYVIFVTVPLAAKYGVIGAAVAWFVEMVISLILYLYFFCKASSINKPIIWCIKNVYIIVLTSMIPAVFLRILTHYLQLSQLFTLLLAIAGGALTLLLLFFGFEKDFLQGVSKYFRSKRRRHL